MVKSWLLKVNQSFDISVIDFYHVLTSLITAPHVLTCWSRFNTIHPSSNSLSVVHGLISYSILRSNYSLSKAWLTLLCIIIYLTIFHTHLGVNPGNWQTFDYWNIDAYFRQRLSMHPLSNKLHTKIWQTSIPHH